MSIGETIGIDSGQGKTYNEEKTEKGEVVMLWGSFGMVHIASLTLGIVAVYLALVYAKQIVGLLRKK